MRTAEIITRRQATQAAMTDALHGLVFRLAVSAARHGYELNLQALRSAVLPRKQAKGRR